MKARSRGASFARLGAVVAALVLGGLLIAYGLGERPDRSASSSAPAPLVATGG